MLTHGDVVRGHEYVIELRNDLDILILLLSFLLLPLPHCSGDVLIEEPGLQSVDNL